MMAMVDDRKDRSLLLFERSHCVRRGATALVNFGRGKLLSSDNVVIALIIVSSCVGMVRQKGSWRPPRSAPWRQSARPC